MEVLYPRCAGLDVHKDTVVASARLAAGRGTVSGSVGLCSALCSAVSPTRKGCSAQAARSIALVDSGWPRLCQPSTLRMVIWPGASGAQNSMAAVSAEGRTVWVLMRRLNPSWSRSTAFVARADLHWLAGRRVKLNNRPPASSKLPAGARDFNPPFRREARRRASISLGGAPETLAREAGGGSPGRPARAW